MTTTRTKKAGARARSRGDQCKKGRPGKAAGRPQLLGGDCMEVMAGLDAGSVDAVVCDPPYGIGWQNEHWDSGAIREATARRGRGGLSKAEAFEVWCELWGRECLRLMKPGAHLLAFGSPRTHHRLAGGLEDAGLEIRDTLIWLHSQGMSMSHRYPGGRRTTLKPAIEPIVVARKPLDGTTAETIARHGTGAMNTDACRVAGGRLPTDAVASHEVGCSEERCVPGCAVGLLDAAAERGDGGAGRQLSPSSFLYCAKPTRAERDAGCQALPERPFNLHPDTGQTAPSRNPHPTLKPIDLMRWLVRLACPHGGLVLDPFMGSGTTGVAAALEGRRFCGIEIEEPYIEIAAARIAHWQKAGDADAPREHAPKAGAGRPLGGPRRR